jgi:hypothetical protein
MDVPTYILNHKVVVDFFGGWPSFHDAEVRAHQPPTRESQSLSFTLHTWLMTDEVDGNGFFVLRNHALVSFRFTGLRDVEMDAFKSQNILLGLELSPSTDSQSFHVVLDSCMEMSGSFSASAGEVASVKSCEKRPNFCVW